MIICWSKTDQESHGETKAGGSKRVFEPCVTARCPWRRWTGPCHRPSQFWALTLVRGGGYLSRRPSSMRGPRCGCPKLWQPERWLRSGNKRWRERPPLKSTAARIVAPPAVRSGVQSRATFRCLKKALKAINDHFRQMPEEEREQGINTFAHAPPPGNLVAELWDQACPGCP
jgi:hypothetical protein